MYDKRYKDVVLSIINLERWIFKSKDLLLNFGIDSFNNIFHARFDNNGIWKRNLLIHKMDNIP